MTVKATLVDDIDDAKALAGTFEYFNDKEGEVAGMFFNCPCGCGKQQALHFRPHASPSWEWDGNRESPTLHPSVHIIPNGKTHWHGWLRNGEWTPC